MVAYLAKAAAASCSTVQSPRRVPSLADPRACANACAPVHAQASSAGKKKPTDCQLPYYCYQLYYHQALAKPGWLYILVLNGKQGTKRASGTFSVRQRQCPSRSFPILSTVVAIANPASPMLESSQGLLVRRTRINTSLYTCVSALSF